MVTFYKLDEAVSESNNRGGSKVFAFEHEAHRSYIVATPNIFFAEYYERQFLLALQQRDSKDFNSPIRWHEVLREDRPCRLYLDLEFPLHPNLNVDGDQLMFSFIDFLIDQFSDHFDTKLSQHDALILDSSTASKFSRHVIFHLPENSAFENTGAAGRFVQFCCDQISLKSVEDLFELGLQDFLVRKSNSQEFVSFCDKVVYGRTRTMRMFLSSKFRKNNPLLLYDKCQFYGENSQSVPLEQVLLDSLIEDLRPVEQLNILRFDKTVELTKQSIQPKRVDRSISKYVMNDSTSNVSFSNRLNTIDITDPSLCAELDSQIIHHAMNVEKDPKAPKIDVYKRSLTEDATCIFYQFKNYNYCQNVQRRHKSNKIYLLIDLRRDHVFQKCFDSDCAGYRSEKIDVDLSQQTKKEIALLAVRKWSLLLSKMQFDFLIGIFGEDYWLDALLPDSAAEKVLQEVLLIDAMKNLRI